MSHDVRFERGPRPMEAQQRPKAVASLDFRTQLVHADEGGYLLSVYPEAGEAVVVAAPPSTGFVDDAVWDEDGVRLDDSCSALTEEERQERNWDRANRRAFTESRRYLVANRLRYMWVLTLDGDGLHGPEGRAEMMRRVAAFVRRFRRAFGDLPYWFSPELHPGGHGWHVNFFIGKRVPHAVVAPLWGHGYVYVSDWVRHDLVKKLRLGFMDALRKAAEYGCKYAAKDWDAEQIGANGRRYEAAEGYKPRRITVRAESLAGGCRRAEAFFGKPAEHVWRSTECKTWEGPMVVTMRWSSAAKSPPESSPMGRPER